MAPKTKTERTTSSTQPAAISTPGYPSLGEHLTSRRDLLTFVGASVAGGALSACFGTTTGGVAPAPQYHTFRLPSAGELETTLASGETVLFYVNGEYNGYPQTDFSVEEELCIGVLGEQTAESLATVDGRYQVQLAIFDTLDPHFEDLGSVALTIVSP